MRKIDFSKLHKHALAAHSLLPRIFGSTRALPPLFVQLELTHRCNLRCAMCFQAKNAEGRDELTTAEFRNIIDQTPRFSVLTITGGEPLMRKDAGELISYALSKRRCNILTNAALLNDDHIRLFVEKGMIAAGISVDGIEETHDRIRGKSGLFEKVRAAAAALSRAKKEKGKRFPLIDIKVTILPDNIPQLAALLSFAENSGADIISYSLPKLSSIQFNEPYADGLASILRAKPDAPMALDGSTNAELHRQLGLIQDYHGPVQVRFYPYNMLDHSSCDAYYKGQLSPSDFAPCRMPWSLCAVSPYGDVFPCLSFRAGNVREDKLMRIWNGPRYRALRKALKGNSLPAFCLGCCYSDKFSEQVSE